MPKKKSPETQDEQSERFRETVRALVAAGELNPIEADKAFERLLERIGSTPTQGQ
jgi:polyhydroxyalkanoate synthesis regulator phasin